MPSEERLVKRAAEAYDFPEPEVATYWDSARQKSVMKIWFRCNMEKHAVEIMYDDPATTGHNLAQFEQQVEHAMRRLEEALHDSDASVSYKGVTYLLRWKQQDYFEVTCPHCNASQFMPFKSRHYDARAPKRDAIMCYLLGEMNCGCQDLNRKV